MPEAFPYRGVVEGYYGRPWSHEDRLWMIERLGRLRMNTYVYAPKNDRLHLESWREPYSPEQMRAFAQLIDAGGRAGVSVGFAMSPGRSITYASPADRELLVRKLRAFREIGATFLSLALDDVPSELREEADRRSFGCMADAHVALVEALLDALPPDVTLWLVPMDYIGTEPTDYLETLGAKLPSGVEVGWTGRTVVSPEIRADEAARRSETLGRKLLIWDNTPVADGPMRCMLHLGPYTGRDPALPEHVSGILLNPMEQAHASLFTLASAAAYLNAPASCDPESAWQQTIEEVGGQASAALRLFACAHRFSALRPTDRDAELQEGLADLRAALARGAAIRQPLDVLRERVAARLAAAETLRGQLQDAKLLEEIEPWLVAHQRETRRIEAALDVMRSLESEAPRSAQIFAFMGMQGRFTLEPGNGKTSYGPRRVLYPQLASMRDDAMGFGSDPALFRDRCLGDEFVALAEERALGKLT